MEFSGRDTDPDPGPLSSGPAAAGEGLPHSGTSWPTVACGAWGQPSGRSGRPWGRFLQPGPRLALFSLLLLPWVGVAAPRGEELPPRLLEAMEVVRSAGDIVEALPVLTGTEAVDVASFRSTLRTLRGESPYTTFMTGQDVTQLVATGRTHGSHLTFFEMGWAALDVNWVFATLLGDADVADALARESVAIHAQHGLYVDAVVNAPQGPVFANFFPRFEAHRYAMLLRQSAAQAHLAAYIPDVIDPEGFVRQRLRNLFERMTNSADLIRDAGEAYSPY